KVRDLDAEPVCDLPQRFVGTRLDLCAVEDEFDCLCRSVAFCHRRDHQAPRGFVNSSRKYLNTQTSGLEAACPSPQIEASRIAPESSVSNASFHGPFCISFTAFSVPTRQGVHWPHDSSSKKRIRFSATAFMSSLSERTTTACEP